MKKYKIFNNFGLKILAVFISVLLWLAVINVSDPVINTSYADIPVVVTNVDRITSQGKVYELTSETTVDISVSAKRSVQDFLSEDNFKAVVDLEDYDDKAGQVPIRIECNKYSGQIESMKPKTEFATVNIEDMLSKQFVITPVVSGEPEEGYIVGSVSTAENIVRISGAESVVSEIKKITAEVSVTALSSDVNTSVDLKLYDKDGEQITDNNLMKNISTVAMSVQILATKELPIRFSTSGVPKDGYGICGELTASKESIVIAGKPTALMYLTSVDITSAAVKVDGADQKVSLEVDLTRYLPDGIVLADPENDRMVTVEVPIDEIMKKEFEIPISSVKMTGLEQSLEAEIIDSDEVILVRLEGFATQMRQLQMKDVGLSVNWEAYMAANEMQKLEEGRYRVPLTLDVPEGITKPANDIAVLIEVKEK